MVTLAKGQFYGQTNITTEICGITLTDTEYTHERVDWHYHENAYFTLILDGRMMEGNKKEVYQCPRGTLLFHNWQDAHYNIKPAGFTRGFHIEIDQGWCNAQEMNFNVLQGSSKLSHPNTTIGAYNIFKESKINDGNSQLAIQVLLINLLSQISGTYEKKYLESPGWVIKIRDLLNDMPTEEWTLTALAKALEIHPVHLSRGFPKYFGANLGDYIRTIKVQRALSMLAASNLSLTDIAYDCGFADQSHFIRCFKAVNQLKPAQFRKIFSI
jgi:AraC family transcriptional regulator